MTDKPGRTFLSPHADPPDAKEFLASLDDQGRLLHKLAKERLGSSYFMERTNSYRKWKGKQSAKS